MTEGICAVGAAADSERKCRPYLFCSTSRLNSEKRSSVIKSRSSI